MDVTISSVGTVYPRKMSVNCVTMDTQARAKANNMGVPNLTLYRVDIKLDA